MSDKIQVLRPTETTPDKLEDEFADALRSLIIEFNKKRGMTWAWQVGVISIVTSEVWDE